MSARTAASSQSWRSWLALSIAFGVLTLLLVTSPFDDGGVDRPGPGETQATATQSETTIGQGNNGDRTGLIPAWLAASIEILSFVITVLSFGMSVVTFRSQRSVK